MGSSNSREPRKRSVRSGEPVEPPRSLKPTVAMSINVEAERLHRVALFEASDDAAAAAAATDDKEPPIALLPRDCIARALTFLSFRERCRTVRPVCRLLAEVCDGDELWVQVCWERGIKGRVVEAEPEDDPEPSLYWPTLLGANALGREVPLPVQLAAVAHASVGCCAHVTHESVERLTREALVPLHAATVTRQADRQRCYQCGRAQAEYMCLTCGVVGCSRGHGGCMASHMERKKKLEQAGADHATVLPCTTAVSQSIVGSDVFCYASGGCSAGPQGALTHGGVGHARLPARTAQLFVSRDVHRSVAHAGLFMRSECPHLDDVAIARFRTMWRERGVAITETNCTAGECLVPRPGSGEYARWPGGAKPCTVRSTFVCLQCGAVMCGIGARSEALQCTGHMHAHSVRTGHVLVMGVRSLHVYCYACDRMLGVGGTVPDTLRASEARRVVTDKGHIFHQRMEVSLWRLLEPPEELRGRVGDVERAMGALPPEQLSGLTAEDAVRMLHERGVLTATEE